MRVAILSGKGGTGKTLVSVNLATVADNSVYIDCDVEEPNGHLFFRPKNFREEKITIKIPQVNNVLCNGCRKCVDFCKFNALVYAGDKLRVFDDICHSCGGCVMLCPKNALTEKEKIIGVIQEGVSQNVTVNSGVLNIGEVSGIPIIKSLLNNTKRICNNNIFIDCPPGSSCAVMESIKDVDYCILVAEPTVFGVHNLNMVYKLVKLFKKKYGVILNKCLGDENPAEKFCLENDIKVLGKIPYDKDLGTLNSNARIAVRENMKYKEMFQSLLNIVIEEAQYETIINS